MGKFFFRTLLFSRENFTNPFSISQFQPKLNLIEKGVEKVLSRNQSPFVCIIEFLAGSFFLKTSLVLVPISHGSRVSGAVYTDYRHIVM